MSLPQITTILLSFLELTIEALFRYYISEEAYLGCFIGQEFCFILAASFLRWTDERNVDIHAQIYSRTPTPGPEFIEKYKNELAKFGYDPDKIKDTPQDCEVMSNSQLTAMMSAPGMQQTLINQFPELGLNSSLELNPFTSIFDTFKKLLALYFKK